MIRHTLALLALSVASLGAQDLRSRITAVGTGTVRLEFPAQEGVCGNGRGSITVRRGDGRTTHSSGGISNGRNEWEDECESGPVRLAVDVVRGTVTDVRAYVGGRWRGEADRDLGRVNAAEASAFLVHLAATADAKPAKGALLPAMLADVPNPWRALLAIAKDTDRPRDVRNSAMFWVGQAAEEAATRGLEEVIESPGDKEVRKSAIFSLSQRAKDESVPALIRIARTHRDPELRRTAIFWLGQSRDDRAVAYFEEVLLGKRDGR